MRSTATVLLIATTLAGAACHTMKPLTLEEVGTMRPSQVRVTRADQSIVVVDGPRTVGDTLAGYVNGQFEELPASDVRQILVKRRAGGKTAALVAAGAVCALSVAYLVSGGGVFGNPEDKLDCGDDPDMCGCPNAPPGC